MCMYTYMLYMCSHVHVLTFACTHMCMYSHLHVLTSTCAVHVHVSRSPELYDNTVASPLVLTFVRFQNLDLQ
jgi:hypothetical protein